MKVTALLGIASILVASAVFAEVTVLPAPKFLKETDRTFTFMRFQTNFTPEAYDSAAVIELGSFFEKDISLSGKLSRRAATIEAKLVKHPDELPASIPSMIRDSVIASTEGYALITTERGAVIYAKEKIGIFYSVVTFLQIIKRSNNVYKLPEVVIADYPSMKLRGISDDISRGQISTMENFKKIIRFCALHKLNVYMPYIENEFAFEKYPSFSAGRAPLTKAEVTELDAYAKMYHVDMIPIFETLGHLEDVLLKDEFEKYAEFPGAASLNVSSEQTYAFLGDLLSEIAPAFSSNYFNMAADESWDVGHGKSRPLVDSIGLARAHAEHYRKVYDILRSFGKSVMMYGDIILNNPEILNQIPRDIIIVDWQYWASFSYPSVKKFKDAGFTFVVSPAVWNFIGPFPNFYNAYANVQFFLQDGYREGAAGAIISTWNDNGGATLRELNYPGYAWGAECAWNPLTASASKFEEEFFKQYFQTESEKPRIIYELLSSPANQILWYEFWRAPFLEPRPSMLPVAVRMESILSSMPLVLDLVRQARKEVHANSDILDLYQLVAMMNRYWADRVLGVQQMKDACSDSTKSNEEKEAIVRRIGDKLMNAIETIESEYKHLYLRTNRYPMLQLLEQRFKDQKLGLKSGIGQILQGRCDYNQLLSSSFIYYPGSKLQKNKRPAGLLQNKVDSATFFKTVELRSVPEKALVQLIGDAYCKLFVNNQFVGQVKARETLTLNVEMQRVKIFDIRPYLHEGENTIVIQAMNFEPAKGGAGCNLYGILGQQVVKTDSTWNVVQGIVAPQQLSDFKEIRHADEYSTGWTVSAPDFELGLKSWIER
ncbi:MAG: family 20 glycosylhydrolase [Bacteroidota bacterium]